MEPADSKPSELSIVTNGNSKEASEQISRFLEGASSQSTLAAILFYHKTHYNRGVCFTQGTITCLSLYFTHCSNL